MLQTVVISCFRG